MRSLEKDKKPNVVNDIELNFPKQNLYFKINYDHGVDVNIIILIQLRYIENNGNLNHNHKIHL